jgi:four helix bundle protein
MVNKVSSFEDLIAWQRSRELTKLVYDITSDGGFSKDYGLREQRRRASVSIMSNIAEGFERGGRNEFHQFLVIAKASCAEVRSQLYVALDAGYLSKELFDRLMALSLEVTRIVAGLRSAVSKQRSKKAAS